jgi:hypothetical protein
LQCGGTQTRRKLGGADRLATCGTHNRCEHGTDFELCEFSCLRMLVIPTCCTHGCASGCDLRLSSRRRISGTPQCGVASPRCDRRCSSLAMRDCGIRMKHGSSPPPGGSASFCYLAASTTQAWTFRRDRFARPCAATPQLRVHRSRAAGSFFGQLQPFWIAPMSVIRSNLAAS